MCFIYFGDDCTNIKYIIAFQFQFLSSNLIASLREVVEKLMLPARSCQAKAIKMTEEWKDIPEYDLYQASNQGRIRNRKSKRIISSVPKGNGYVHVTIRNNGKYTCPSVHKLVALAFLPNDEKKPTVNHKDKNRSNNNVENLEWATHSEQVTHAREIQAPEAYDRIVVFDAEQADEEWKYIEEYRIYVSNYGKVRSENKEISVRQDNRGYCTVKTPIGKICYTHRLVAMAFLDFDPDKNVNHKDGNKANNHVSNLEMLTQSRNILHAYETGLLTKSNLQPVYQVNYKGDIINKFDSITQASDVTGYNRGCIHNAINNSATSKGYRWYKTYEEYKAELDSGQLFKNFFKVIQCDEYLNIIATFDSFPQAEAQTRVPKAGIAQSCYHNCNGGSYKWFNNYAQYLEKKKT